VQQDDVLETELGVLELELRELRELRDGTSEPTSESESDSDSESESWTLARENLAVSCSRVGAAKASVRTMRVSWGL
jgi:hypothetical protein